MEERWEFSPVGAGFYCSSQLSNNFKDGPEYKSKFRRLLFFLFGNLRFSPCAQEIFALSSFIQPCRCCRISRLLPFQFEAAFS